MDIKETAYSASFEKLWNINGISNIAEVPILLKGRPGIGKTAMVEWLAKELGRDLVTVVVADSDPCDMSGVWTTADDNKSAVRLVPQKLMHDKPIVIFLDEFTAGSPEQMAAAAKLTDGSRMIGDYKIHDDTLIIAAINPDNAIGAASKIAAPLLTRFRHLDVDYSQAVAWMCRQEGMVGKVGAWLTVAPEAAIDSDDVIAACVDNIKPFACPRTWTRAATQYPNNIERWFEYVGTSVVKFADFMDGTHIPSVASILDDCDCSDANIPNRDDLVHVAGVGAASRIETAEQAVNLMTWCEAASKKGKLGALRLAASVARENSRKFKEFHDMDWPFIVKLHDLFDGML